MRRKFQTKAMACTALATIPALSSPRLAQMSTEPTLETQIISEALRNCIQTSGAAVARQRGFLHNSINVSWSMYVRADSGTRLMRRVTEACRGTTRMTIVERNKKAACAMPNVNTLSSRRAIQGDILRKGRSEDKPDIERGWMIMKALPAAFHPVLEAVHCSLVHEPRAIYVSQYHRREETGAFRKREFDRKFRCGKVLMLMRLLTT